MTLTSDCCDAEFYFELCKPNLVLGTDELECRCKKCHEKCRLRSDLSHYRPVGD